LSASGINGKAVAIVSDRVEDEYLALLLEGSEELPFAFLCPERSFN
jgi:hypothetical protein